MAQFVHLHLHTQYSLLDGLNKISEVTAKAAKLGQPAVAITDHGNLHGAIEFYESARKAGVKPIIGCEFYVTPGSRLERKQKKEGGAGTYHCTMLAQNIEGYRNLCRLSTLAFKEGFYFKPRIDRELMEKYSDGLIVLSGCLAGEMAEAANMEALDLCRKTAEFYRSIYGDRYYLEVQPHEAHEQKKLNTACADLGRSMGIPLVATCDCHYLNEEDHHAQEVLMCISTGTQITDPERMRHEDVKLYLRSADEMLRDFEGGSFAPEAIANSLTIAERCNLEFDFSTHYMPVFKSSKVSADDAQPEEDLAAQMSHQAREGLKRRLEQISSMTPGWSEVREKEYWDRLEQEITMICEMGFPGYFLICSDFIVWSKENGVPVGPGRGSAAGSLVAYAMRITDLDPIANKLLFERFLNPKRVSLPDIDVDFCINGRDRVIKYVVEKYGADKVSQIATFGTLKAKAAIKDVGRVLGRSYAEMDRVAQLVPAPRQGFDYPLKEALSMEKRLAEYAEGEGQEIISLAMKVEGLNRHSSTHAAGVVIGDRTLTDLLPMMVDKDGNDVTQYSMKYVEKIGLLKFDFLGLKTLTVIHTALRLVKESRGVEIELDKLPLNDPKTFALLCSGNTTGVFQLESTGITEMTMRLKPSSFDDLVAILALYRPGPLDAGMVDHYIERKHGREQVTWPHPLMKPILQDTYGIILYQEQIMQIAQNLAGYSLGEADLLRRAMGKKNPEEMAKHRDRFISGAVERKLAKSLATEIFDQMETFARYGFNRSHSAAYALVSYQTAWIKTHYPVEFMAALMSHEMDDSDKTLKNINECRKRGVRILPPDVNVSSAGFSVDGDSIRFGLSAVKGIGDKAVAAIEEARELKGLFKSFEDFASRVDLRQVNRRVFESLIKCGAFDSVAQSRRDMYEHLEDVLKTAQLLQREESTSQVSLFGGPAAQRVIPRRGPVLPEWPVNQKLLHEKEALGFYISGHPLEKYRRALKQMGVTTAAEMRRKQRNSQVSMGAVVTALKLKNTRKGDRYASFMLEDWGGAVEAIAWPDVYKKIAALLTGDEPVLISGRADVTEEHCTVIVDNMESLLTVRDRKASQGLLAFDDRDFEPHLDALLAILHKHQGKCPVKVRLTVQEKEVLVMLRDRNQSPVCVVPSETVCDEVEQLFGRPVLSFL